MGRCMSRTVAAELLAYAIEAMNDAPIGIFDSGVGGLTVTRAILDQLPYEPVFYLGDTAHAPYGPRTIAEIRALALRAMDFLVGAGVKMLVIACNSASSAVLRDARERYDVPLVEVIQPAARRAAAVTRERHIGIIGTRATIVSRAYEDALAAVPELRLTVQACPRFVSLVEEGITHGPELERIAHEYLVPVRDAGVDTLILGCTHYPVLTGVISYVMGKGVTLVSSAEETAEDVYRVLTQHNLMRNPDRPHPSHHFTVTGDPERFYGVGSRFLGPQLSSVTRATALRVGSPPTTTALARS